MQNALTLLASVAIIGASYWLALEFVDRCRR